jgi:hypothetical protein
MKDTKGAVRMNIGQSSDQVYYHNLSKERWPMLLRKQGDLGLKKKKYLDPLGFSKCIQNR